MKKLLAFTVYLVLSITVVYARQDEKVYLEKVLKNLEAIKSAAYVSIFEPWQHGGVEPMAVYTQYTEEYDNPEDSLWVGATFVRSEMGDQKAFIAGYDGKIRAVVYPEEEYTMVDDFTFRSLPFRPISPPFFNYTKNIIAYALRTGDNIHIDLEERENDYHFKLTINEEQQVEFFGKAYHIDNKYCEYPTSIYEIWISKSNDLPYKCRREMSHNISVTTIEEPILNRSDLSGFDLYSYFNPDYEIRPYGQKRDAVPREDLTGKAAPDWTLNDLQERPMSLSALKAKVVLIQFTGIGCGPCYISIPFLNGLRERFSEEEVEIIAIEMWGRKPRDIQDYVNKNEISYSFISGADDLARSYQTGGSVPVFFLLDEQRVVRKVQTGYIKNKTDDEILTTLQELL